VLPLWESAQPDDLEPRQLVQQTVDFLRGNIELDKADDRWSQSQSRFSVETIAERWEEESAPDSAWRARLAASFAFTETEIPHPFLTIEISDRDTDQDVDPWSRDVAGWVVEAEAGAVWEDESDSSKRPAFWGWWLTEALPSARSEASQPT